MTFWQKAAASLPAPYRSRYAGYFARAEKWEQTFDGLVDLWARALSKEPSHTPSRPRSA